MRKSEPELFKDKVEVILDGRQIFYLFFGAAAIACLLFVLGVMVGKRVEARSHVARTATGPARDPLAALDQLEVPRPGAPLRFQTALAGGVPAQGQVERTIAGLDRAESPPGAPAGPAVPRPPAAQPKPDAVKPPEVKPETLKPPEVKPAVVATSPTKPASKPPAKPAPTPDHQADDAEPASRPDADQPRGKYTLLISTFEDRAKADALAGTLDAAGYPAHVASSDVEGKGTVFRVRVGSYASYDAAIAAKRTFEGKVKKIAYVHKL